MCHGLVIRFVDRPQEAVHEAAVAQVLLELGLVVLAAAHLPEHRDRCRSADEVDHADEQQEEAGDRGADQAGAGVQAEESSLTWPASASAPTASSTASTNTIVEWPRENQKPTETGRLPSAISLRVVLSMAAMWSASNACRMPKV